MTGLKFTIKNQKTDAMNNNLPPLPEQNGWWKDNWIFFVIPVGLLFVISLPFLIKAFIFQAYKIRSGSMLPTLLIGDHILVDKTYSTEDIKRGDIIIFSYPSASSHGREAPRSPSPSQFDNYLFVRQ